jgi:hypothetical protein
MESNSRGSAAPGRIAAEPGPVARHVCPFCGAISEKPDQACPRCNMENTALTRQATRARIGPWYVLQSRNPAAPGMKFNTMLALIRKGQVTPRSVVRGPTTHQLWRFAGRVKGLSREFSLCYSCTTEIEKTAKICPHCSRSQELPANPDALLEADQQAGKTVFVDVKSPEAYSAAANPSVAVSAASTVSPVVASAPVSVSPKTTEIKPAPSIKIEVTEPQPEKNPIGASPQVPGTDSRGSTSNGPAVVAATTMTALAGLPSPENAPVELQSRPRQTTPDRMLSPRDLAAAFSLHYDPKTDKPAKGTVPQSFPGKGRRIFAILVVVLILGGAAVTFVVPSIREPSFHWLQKQYYRLNAMAQSSPTSLTPPSEDTGADSTPTTPKTAPTVDLPVVQTPQAPSHPAEPSFFQSPPQADTTVTPTVPAAARNNPVPAPAATITPPKPIDPAVPVGPLPRIPSAADISSATSAQLDSIAMQLRAKGMDAESQHNYNLAQYIYEQIEKQLPREHWPADIELRLKYARQMADADKSAGH